MMKMSPQKVSSLIKVDLKRKDLRQKDLAREAGVSVQWMTKMLSGEDYLPENWAIWFEMRLGYNPEFLMKGSGPLYKNTPSYDALCDLIREYRDLETKEERQAQRLKIIMESSWSDIKEKKMANLEYQNLRTKLFFLRKRLDEIVSHNINKP